MTNISIESAATTVRRFECGDYQLLVIRAGEAEITLHCTLKVRCSSPPTFRQPWLVL